MTAVPPCSWEAQSRSPNHCPDGPPWSRSCPLPMIRWNVVERLQKWIFFSSWYFWLQLTKPMIWPSLHRFLRWSYTRPRFLCNHVQNGSLHKAGGRAGARLFSEVSPGQQCTLNPRVLPKQLVPQHAQLLQVKVSANTGQELPTKSRAQQAPGGLWAGG